MTTPLILPPNLAGLTKFTNSQPTKYAISGVEVSATDVEGGYAVLATDCKRLVMVEGVPEAITDVIPALASAPNGATRAIIPAKVFNKALTNAGKLGVYSRFQQTQVVLSKDVTTLASTDLDATNLEQTKNVEGRFPPVRDVLPKTAPVAKIAINGKLAAEMLTFLAKISAEDSSSRVDLEIHEGNKLLMKSKSKNQNATALLIGLS